MAVWPATLPQSLDARGLSQSEQSAFIRTDMETGPPKQRGRHTVTPEQYEGVMLLTNVQRQTFLAFWKNDLAHGALSFDWVHPIDGSPATVRFTRSYQIQARGTGVFYDLSLGLEVLS